MRTASWVCLAAAVSLGCGGSGPTGPDPTGSGGQSPTGGGGSGGSPSGGGGTPSSGGGTPGGGGTTSGGGGGAADGGGTTGGGGTSGGGTSGAGGSPAPTATLDRLDANAECDGLLPGAVVAPVEATLAAPVGFGCAWGTSDGTGAVVLGARDAAGNGSFRAYTAAGEPRKDFQARTLFTEPSGWQGAIDTRNPAGAITSVAVLTFSPAGDVVHREEEDMIPDPFSGIASFELQQDPLGGSALFLNRTHPNGTAWRVLRYDAGGAPRGTALVSKPFLMAHGVSRQGDAMTLSYTGGPALEWFAPDGRPEKVAEDWDSFRAQVMGFAQPLLDGSLVAWSDGRYTRLFPYLSEHGEPPPSWLGPYATWTIHFTRGNKGYAFFSPAGEGRERCDQLIDLVAPSGRLCGRITLLDPAGTGAACTAGALDQGWDGTVVQQSGRDACHFRWWPRLLAGD